MTLRAGKLPQAMLAELLATIAPRDPRVIVGPGIGRDAAVIDMGGGRTLVAKTDPITFATDEIGRYAVHVNANDIACMGARPTWMLATALLPDGAGDDLPRRIFAQLRQACDDLGVTLVGGHTEVTPGIDRPLVVGAMIGEAAREEIVTGERIAEGDVVLLTKGIAIEGTAVLAREAAPALRAAGIEESGIAAGAALLREPGISVVVEARAICDAVRPHGLHDPTEGGLATALGELAHSGGCAIRIDPGAVRVLPETRAFCVALGLEPLGLLASGSLLAAVGPGDAAAAIEACEQIAIPCAVIGTVVPGPRGVILGAGDPATPFPVFSRDEIARFFDEVERAL